MNTVYCMLLTLGVALWGGKKTDFSGTYRVNVTSSNLGPAPEWILPRYLKVEQHENSCVIARTALNKELQEQTPVADTLSFAGTPFLRTAASGNTTTTTLNWSTDTSFTIVKKTTNAGNTVVSGTTEEWTLEAGGKVLIVNRAVEQQNGMKFNTRAVFERL